VTEPVLQCGDCLELMRAMPANSVDLIATDPPYFKVKGEAWDRQWDTPKAFLAWMDLLAEQWARILRSNGSLYVCASPQMRARVELKIGERFNTLPTITWVKGDAAGNGWWSRANKDKLRSYFPQTEAIIFAEHKSADNMAKGEAGYAAKCDELRGFVFEPLRAYLDGERQRAGVAPKQCNEALGNQMAGHYFTRVQWSLPTRASYEKLRDLFNRKSDGHLRREYEDLRREYEDLRREYEDLRRPFAVTAAVPYTDVWTFPAVAAYKGKHPCEKPAAMMEHIVRTSSRPGGVVLDCFMGSGVTGEAALKLGRQFIGMEMDPGTFASASARVMRATPTTQPAPLVWTPRRTSPQLALWGAP